MRFRSFWSVLLGIVCGFGVCCRIWSGELPRVGIIGRYQEQYDTNYRDAGCELVQLKEADLLAGDLSNYRMIHFAHWTKIPLKPSLQPVRPCWSERFIKAVKPFAPSLIRIFMTARKRFLFPAQNTDFIFVRFQADNISLLRSE